VLVRSDYRIAVPGLTEWQEDGRIEEKGQEAIAQAAAGKHIGCVPYSAA